MRLDAHGAAGRRAPLDDPREHAGAPVEPALVAQQLAVADVERLVVDQQPDDLAVGDVDDRLAVLRVAVGGLGVRQRAGLVEAVEVGAREAERLALVEVAAQADVAVGEREDRLGVGETLEVELGLVQAPGLDRELRAVGHSSSSRSCDDDAWRRARRGRRPGRPGRRRSRPRSSPARPASTPASASSNTAACAGSAPEHPRALDERVRLGLARQALLLGDDAVHARLDQRREPGDLEDLLGVARSRRPRRAAGRLRAPPPGSCASPRRPSRRPRGSSSGPRRSCGRPAS